MSFCVLCEILPLSSTYHDGFTATSSLTAITSVQVTTNVTTEKTDKDLFISYYYYSQYFG